MFKKTTSKESKIKDIVKFLKLLPEAQIDQVTEALLYGRISAVSATRLIEPTAQTTKIVESDEVTESTATEKITSATKSKRMSQKQVQKIHENRIGMVQIPNGNWQAKTGDVDGQFTAFAELSEWLVVSPNPKNRKENRIFLNTDDKKLKAKFVTQCKKEGFEVSFN